MKFIYVLEDDERTNKDLYETLKGIDPQLHIRFFHNLTDFHEWLKLAITEGPKALAQGGAKYPEDLSEDLTPADTHELRLVIAKNEFLGVKNMGLIKRAREFFIRKKMCSEQEPTALILTAFDSPDFDITLAEERIINNVIFKPFDKLILKQHIEYALSGHHPVKSDTISSIKIQSTIEMLKDINLCGISELGFITLNNHEIKIGAISKYYSEDFQSDSKKSIYAYCKSCKEISPKEFLCEFHFFGADNQQISQIRRKILQNKSHQSDEIKNTHGHKSHVLILCEDQNINTEIKNFFVEKTKNVQVYTYSVLTQLLSDLDDKDTAQKQVLPPRFDLVISDYGFFEIDKEKTWEMLKKSMQDRAKKKGSSPEETPDLILVSRKKILPDEMRNISTWAHEVFFTPLDKSYVTKKIFSRYSRLINKESTSVASMPSSSTLKVANPVEITQISEAGLVLKYYRAMSTGAFREFILWRPQEVETPEIIGTVNFSEKDKNGGDHFLNHFVFFGMKDLYLKHIRLWLREAYIKGKEKS